MSAVADQAEQSKRLLRRITDEIWCGGRIDLVEELVAKEFVDHVELAGIVGGGRDHYRASVELIRSAFPDYSEQIVWLVAEGDLAVSCVRCSGTHLGSLQGIEPTGRRVEWGSMGALRFENAQAVERWGYGDSLGMIQQLGVFG
jgi:predicted ester cyclase